MLNYSEGQAQQKPLYERILLTDWNLSPDKAHPYTPQVGRVVTAITLGPKDTSGGFRVDSADVMGGAEYQPLVDPYAGYISPGTLRSPFVIRPSLQIAGLAVGDTVTRQTLDAYVWYDCVPPWVPRRGPFNTSFLFSGSAGTTDSSLFPVFGRKRTVVTLWNATGGAVNSIDLKLGVVSGSGLVYPTIVRFGLVAGEGAVYEFNEGQGIATGAPGGAGSFDLSSFVPSVLQFLRLSNSGGVGADVTVTIEARDY